jgi:hypothetical protein
MSRAIVPVVLLCGLAAAQCASAAETSADSSAVHRAFGNTIVSTYPDGRTGELWLAPGGAYTAKGRRGDPSRGHWRVKGDRLCLTQVRPIPALGSFCTPIPEAGMGKPWSAKAVTGEAITVKVVEGRYEGTARSPHKS